MKRAMKLICPLRNSMTAIREKRFSVSVKEQVCDGNDRSYSNWKVGLPKGVSEMAPALGCT
jgi:hypothetical protein